MVTKPIWPNGRFGVPQITPYTYRDGQTLLELITALRDHVVEQLHPNLQKAIDQLVADVETEYGKAHDRYVDGVQEFQRIHDSFMADVNASLVALNDGAVTDLVSDNTSLLGTVLREIFTDRKTFADLSDDIQFKITKQDQRITEQSQQLDTKFDGLSTQVTGEVNQVRDELHQFQTTTTSQLAALEMHPALVRFKAQLAFGEGGQNNLSWIIFLGSSTTGGANIANVKDRWVFRLKDYLKNVYPKTAVTYTTLSEAATYRDFVDQGVHVVNGGIGGTTSRNYVDQAQLNRIGALDGRFSFVHMIGSNDQSLNISPSEYAANVEQSIAELDQVTGRENVHILIHSYERLDVVDKPDIEPWDAYRDALSMVADRSPNTRMFINLAPHYQSLGFPYADDLGIMQERVHQNEKGHHLMADLIRDYLRIPDVSVSPQYTPRVVGADRFVSSGMLTSASRATDQGTWYRRGAQWDCVAGYANPRGDSVGMMTTATGGHGVEARLRLHNVPDGGRAGVVVALRSSKGSHYAVYFQNERLVIARVNSEGTYATQTSVGHLMNDEVYLKVEYNRGLVNVWVNNVLKLSHRAIPLQEFFHSNASWCGMYANRAMTNVFREVRVWTLESN